MRTTIAVIVTVIVMVVVVITPAFALAQVETCGPTPQGNYRLCSAIPGIEEVTGIADLIKQFFRFALVAGGTVAFILVIIGGITLILESGNVVKQGQARARITSAIVGLLLLMGSTLILYNLNPELITIEEPGLPEPSEARDLEEMAGALGKNLTGRAVMIEARHQQFIETQLTKRMDEEKNLSEQATLMRQEITVLENAEGLTADQRQRLAQLKTEAPAAENKLLRLKQDRLSAQLTQVQDQINQMVDKSQQNWKGRSVGFFGQWLGGGRSFTQAAHYAGLKETERAKFDQLLGNRASLVKELRQVEQQLGIPQAEDLGRQESEQAVERARELMRSIPPSKYEGGRPGSRSLY